MSLLKEYPVRAAKSDLSDIQVVGKCAKCTGSKCCTYVTHHIDAPRSKEDFDHLLWQVSHQNVSAFKDEGKWFLLFNSRCEHLAPNGGCGIYETRPQICRDHSNDYCEYDAPAENDFELYFPDYNTLLSYCKKRFRNWGKQP